MGKHHNLVKISKTSLIVAIAFGLGCTYSNVIANNTLQSQGKLVYNDIETGQEVVIDTADHQLLQDAIDSNTEAIEKN